MESLTGILDILIVCIWIGVLLVCAILVFSGVLRWLASSEGGDRKKPQDDQDKQSEQGKRRASRLNIAGWIAFAILVILFFYSQRANIAHFISGDDGSQTLTLILINGSKMMVKFLLLGAVISISAIVLMGFIVLLNKSVRTAFRVKDEGIDVWAKKFANKGRQFGTIFRSSIFTFIVTCGILLVFIILPLFLGSSENIQSGNMGLTEIWIDGVQTFATSIGKTDDAEKSVHSNASENTDASEDGSANEDGNPGNVVNNAARPLSEAILTYVLVYVIVLGVGFSFARILYAIVKDSLKQKQVSTLIDEYSNSIGVLGVGVSILLVIQDDSLNIYHDNILKTLGIFLKYFAIVAIVVATGILVLEIIRLIMDMRETLIRKEAKYLFVTLVGRASLFILTLLDSIISSLSNAVGQQNSEDTYQIHGKVMQRITQAMETEIDSGREQGDVTFACFKETITKK